MAVYLGKPRILVFGASGGGGSIVTGTTPSNGTSNVLLKTSSAGKVANATGLTNDTGSGKELVATSQAVGDVPITTKGFAGQTGNLFEATDSTSNIIAHINSAGQWGVGSPGGGRVIRVGSGGGIELTDSFNTTAGFVNPNGNPMPFGTIGIVQLSFWPKTIVSGVATSIFDIPLPTLTGFGAELVISAQATNATDIQIRNAIVRIEAINKGGVYTTNATVVSEGAVLSTGTLTMTYSFVNGTNKTTLQITVTSSITPTLLRAGFSLINTTANGGPPVGV